MKPPAHWVLLFALGGAVGFVVHALGAAPGPAAAAAPEAAVAVARGGSSSLAATAALTPAPAPMAELRLPSAAPDLAPRLKMSEALEAAQLLERARALVGSNPAAALELTSEHDRAFPEGQLGAESDLIAAQALLALNDAPAARERARRGLARHPGGAFARPLRAIVDSK